MSHGIGMAWHRECLVGRWAKGGVGVFLCLSPALSDTYNRVLGICVCTRSGKICFVLAAGTFLTCIEVIDCTETRLCACLAGAALHIYIPRMCIWGGEAVISDYGDETGRVSRSGNGNSKPRAYSVKMSVSLLVCAVTVCLGRSIFLHTCLSAE